MKDSCDAMNCAEKGTWRRVIDDGALLGYWLCERHYWEPINQLLIAKTGWVRFVHKDDPEYKTLLAISTLLGHEDG